MVLCGTKNGSYMASLEEPFEAPLFLRVYDFFSSFLISSSTPDNLRLPQKAKGFGHITMTLVFSIKVVTFHWLLLLSQTSFCNEFLSTPHKSNPYVNLSAFYYCHLDIIYCVYLAYFLLLSPQCRQKRIQKHNYSNKTLLQKAACSYKTHPNGSHL